ncbi:type II CAAX endopeptidase family protein [Nocardioides sp. KR10-350]|uniref:CPBP family intramembrane glutamic endopeptidase n=1 Tax=Nocardioides cheoyonin TaxID=3156615 RepID=UPI0032B58EAA
MPVTVEPGGGLEYHQLQRGGRSGWGWTALGVVSLVVLTLVVAPTVLLAVFLIGYAVHGTPLSDAVDQLSDTSHVTPATLAYINAGLAAAIPIAMLVSWLVHGLRPRWLASVRPRIRWRWLLTCFGLAAVTLVVTVLVANLLPAQGDTADMSGSANHFTSETRDFLLVILFLTPLQAAGEEYAFRGYLTQAFGGLLRSRVAAVVLPAFLFALAHGGQDVPIFFDRFAFGLVAGVLVIVTGGLEAGIAMHVLNNFLAFGVALAYGDISSTLNVTSGSWWNVPVTLTQSLVYLGLATLVARRRGLATRTAAPAGRADFVEGVGRL